MSIEDDIFDVRARLKGFPEEKSFERVDMYLGNLEADHEIKSNELRIFKEFRALLLEPLIKRGGV